MLSRRGTSSASSSGFSSSSIFPSNPVSNGRHRSRRRRLLRRRKRAHYFRVVMMALVAIVLCFGLVDLYYLVTVTKHHKLSEIKPAFQKQGEKVKEVWREENEEMKEELGYLLSRNHHEHSDKPTFEKIEDENDDDADVDVDADKDEIYTILQQAGLSIDDLDIDTKRRLPTWTMVREAYGSEPVIYGLERCSDFTSNVEPSVSFLGIAGTFNSGTNLLAELLIQNCQIRERMALFGEEQKGMRWQVPWGKHTPVEYREEHVTTTDKDVPLENSFPMITIRDPYRWMRSMCKHIYGARWFHNKTTCPNVWSYEAHAPTEVRVKYAATFVHHESLPGFWNDWYNGYSNAHFPRIIVRFEDLLFHAKNVTETLCKCGGGEPRRKHFRHVKASAKLGTAAHGANKTDLLDALIQFGSNKGRLNGMVASDITHSRDLLDPFLMEKFQYKYADLKELKEEMG